MRVRSSVVALAVLSVLLPAGKARAEDPLVHTVRAGGTVPGAEAEPISLTAYYPQRIQVHRGDLVRWEFAEGYNGWHSVSFEPVEETPALWRDDEYPGFMALDEEWLFGPEAGDQSRQCGLGPQFGRTTAQEPCSLDADALAARLSSSIWDRFVQTPYAGSFQAVVELPPGTYGYHCRLHLGMTGAVEVVPDEAPLDNPTSVENDARMVADLEAARDLFDQLNDPASAWDPQTGEWVVQMGAETADGRAEIFQFLPTDLPIREGERVRFEAATTEPNSVAFPDDAQGGFNFPGSCSPGTCTEGTGLPWGQVGSSFLWDCDLDEPDGGLPGVLLSYDFARTQPGDPSRMAGCNSVSPGAQTEMIVSPVMTVTTQAPGDAVATEATYHVSGAMMDADLPDWAKLRPDGTPFPSVFHAGFPNAGTFAYACLNHEFMRGTISVN